tara:strand:- start:63 stop:233 length:171 start_codon:yes stop_codon:yes gene_type:complete
MTRYETNITNTIIIDQMNIFIKNCFNLELELKKLGRIRIKIAIKKIDGIICSNPMF